MSDEPRKSSEAGVRWRKERIGAAIEISAKFGKWTARISRPSGVPDFRYAAALWDGRGNSIPIGEDLEDLDEAMDLCQRRAELEQ
jgi:hypothetical protein